MKFKVYELGTDKDVTDEKGWYIDTEGNLLFMTNDVDNPLYIASGEYYYKLEIEVL
jgi:hypothetical protein